jgi:micrococcal nuclease
MFCEAKLNLELLLNLMSPKHISFAIVVSIILLILGGELVLVVSRINHRKYPLYELVQWLTDMGGQDSKHYETVNDIPTELFKQHSTIKGIVVKVTDGDTCRIRHITTSSSQKFDGKLSEHTLPVRFAAIDAPETAKFGEKGQLFAKEAKEFVESCILNREVQVKLLSKDQYGRVVGRLKYRSTGILSWFQDDKDVSEEVLRRGLATVYRQGGAQYDGSIDKWIELEKKAQQKKVGMWSNGVNKAELPAEYKKSKKMRKSELAETGNRNRA